MTINLNIGAEYELLVGDTATPTTEVQLAESVQYGVNNRKITKALRTGSMAYRCRPGFAEWTASTSLVEDDENAAWIYLEEKARTQDFFYLRVTSPSGKIMQGRGFIEDWQSGQENEDIVSTSVTFAIDGEMAPVTP